MAEKGAHLTGTILSKPSIFEIIAQESLAYTVEPAFKKLLTVLVWFNEERYGHILKWSDEIFLIFNTVLQRYYLKKFSASFSETFYGLKRVSLTNNALQGQLTRKQETLSLIFLVIFPYLKIKFADLSQRYKLEEVEGHKPKNIWQKLFRTSVIKGHGIFSVIYECMVLYNYVQYVSGRSINPTPLCKLLSITLIYADKNPDLTIDELLNKINNNTFNIDDSIDIIQRIITRILELGAFFLQFMHWWNQENYYSNITALPVPPAPKIPEIAIRYKGVCPICLKTRRIDTVLLGSGYVFCYQCILPKVQANKECPITHYPASEDDLIRLYTE